MLDNECHYLLSGSSDRTVKLWDLRNYATPVSTINFENPVEDFCLRNNGSEQQLVVAHGNTLSMVTNE